MLHAHLALPVVCVVMICCEGYYTYVSVLQRLLSVHRDLDDVGAVEPVAILGGDLPQDDLSKEEKKKLRKKQQKVMLVQTVHFA